MVPILARRGRLVLGSALLFVMIGGLTVSAPVVALGGAALAALMSAYLGFFPAAILLRRRKIELSWWIPPGDQPGGALAVNRPFQVHIALRNHGGRRLRVLELQLFGTGALDLPRGLEAAVPAGTQVELAGEAQARAAGYHVLHGAVLAFGDALGLFEVHAYFPNPIAVKVFPRRAVMRGAARPGAGGAAHERIGVHQVRRRGLAGELRELREHSHGDPFKLIAWKATARRQRLMVRDLETEIVLTHQLLLDIGGSMRGAPPGRRKLDHAIEVAAALARGALDGGDRVGLCAYDSRVYSELRAGDGHHHYLKLVDRLLETHNVVDEDLTDLTNGELVGAVARYLAHQEAIDVRVRRPPPLHDPAWEGLHAGPGGELYDMAALSRAVHALLRGMNQASRSLAPAWWWQRAPLAGESDPAMARLRLFCRLRGIELPYRPQHPRGARALGLVEAARRVAAAGRADLIVLLSDLDGVVEHPAAAAPAFAQLRRVGRVVVLAAESAPPVITPTTASGAAVAAVFARDEADRLAEGTRLLARWGVPVLRADPQVSPAALVSRLARAATTARRVA